MKYVISALIGLVWGFLMALLNAFIMKGSIKKGNSTVLFSANIGRTFIDIAGLALVFLLRKYLPSFETVMIATAVALSVTTIFFAYKIARTQ